MLFSIKNLQGYKVNSVDGEVGQIDDLYFDEGTRHIRYLVVDMGNWLSHNKVLIVPNAVTKIDSEEKVVQLVLTKEQVENALAAEEHKPISHLKENLAKQHDKMTPKAYHIGIGTFPQISVASLVNLDVTMPQPNNGAELAKLSEQIESTQLRSAKEVIGYDIQLTDGGMGQLEDMVFDAEPLKSAVWMIYNFIIDTRKWLPGKKVGLASDWLSRIRWADSEIFLDLPKDIVKAAPEFDFEKVENMSDSVLDLFR